MPVPSLSPSHQRATILRIALPAATLLGLFLVGREIVLSHSTESVAGQPPKSVITTTQTARVETASAPDAMKPAAAERKRDFTLDAATAAIGRDGKPQSSAQGLFDRAFIPTMGETPVRVSIPEFLAGEEVTITAPNGGKLKRRDGELSFTPKADGPATLDLTFEPTMGRGVYTIAIRQAGALAVLDFWAGAPNPVGQPGPAYVAIPSTETSVETLP